MKYILKGKTYFFGLILIAVCACDPLDIPGPEDENPLFESTFTLDDEIYRFQAGKSDYIMFNDFEKDSLNIQTFISRFEQENCIDQCFPKLSFEIRDNAVFDSQTFDINNSIAKMTYNYNSERDKIADELRVEGIYQGPANSNNVEFSWDFNETPLNVNTPLAGFEIQNDENIAVCLTAFDNLSNCWMVNCADYSPFGEAKCYINLDVVQKPNGSVEIIANGTGKGQLMYSFQGQAFSSANVFTYFPEFSSSVLVELIDEGGNSAVASTCLIVHQDSILISNVYINHEYLGDYSTPERFGEVKITYTDGTGKVYRSDLATQTANTYFEIVAIADYVNNDFGSPTKQVDVIFNAVLQSADGDAVQLENAEATIAIAYPE